MLSRRNGVPVACNKHGGKGSKTHKLCLNEECNASCHHFEVCVLSCAHTLPSCHVLKSHTFTLLCLSLENNCESRNESCAHQVQCPDSVMLCDWQGA